MLSRATIRNLPNNNRFYIFVFSFLLSVFTLCWLRVQIVSDQLFYIRLEQVYGFISIAYLYVALIISPLKRAVGRPRWMKNLEFARRGIGVSAAYFAFLHAGVALWGQMGGFGGLGALPERFIWALGFGVIALVMLLLMAATSFDKVMTLMTFRKWKWLHRFVYMACVLIILHVWMIGTHVAYGWVRLATFVPLSVLFGLEAWCIVSKLSDRYSWLKAKDYAVTIAICIWAALSLLLFMVPALVQNYHGEHHAGHADYNVRARSGADHE